MTTMYGGTAASGIPFVSTGNDMGLGSGGGLLGILLGATLFGRNGLGFNGR